MGLHNLPEVVVCSGCKAPRPCHCERRQSREPPFLTVLDQPVLLSVLPKVIPRWESGRFLTFVRGLPCCVPDCAEWRRAEPHHAGPRAAGRKVHDFLAIPLCRHHHGKAHARGQAWRWYPFISQWQVKTIAAAILAGVFEKGRSE